MKKTPWFPGHIKPVRDGVYQRLANDGETIYHSLWRAGVWYAMDKSCDGAASNVGLVSIFQDDRKWRGILKD